MGVLTAALLLGSAAPATASFRGTPGKVIAITANWNLEVWDPVTRAGTIITSTVEPQTDSSQWGTNGRPVWSPDGTRVAFVKTVPDPGNWEADGHPVNKHTAIFTYNISTGSLIQVTEPGAGLKPQEVDGGGFVGHVVADYAPSWSGDGSTIAFARDVLSLGEEDSEWDHRGINLWTTPAGGGRAAAQVTHYTDPLQGQVLGTVGVPEKGGYITVVKRFSENGGEPFTALKREGGTGRRGVLVERQGLATISDYDVSPDGNTLVWSEGNIGPTFAGRAYTLPLDSNGPETSLGQWPGTFVRFSNTGSGVLRFGCSSHGPQQCGMAEQLLPDPNADIRPNEPARIVNAVPHVGPVGAGGSITSIDVQPQILPVIYIPGFAGSQILCGGGSAWPGLRVDRLGLDAAGIGSPDCPAANVGGIVRRVGLGRYSADIYDGAARFIENRFGATRGSMFAWDWRKTPRSSLTLLNDAVDKAIKTANGIYAQDVRRVAIIAHSYGGLLTRMYVDRYKEKVARVVTLGTPYWGSPKAIFTLAIGQETPSGELGLDTVVNLDHMQKFARNLAGNYQLYPSATFGPWLRINGVPQNATGIGLFIRGQNGNPAMFTTAQADHASLYDGFFDNSSLIDMRAVAGTGEPTYGSVHLKTDRSDDLVDATVGWVSGDGTVPANSAAQGPPGVFPPKGDPIHVQRVCGIGHVPLGGDSNVLDAYADFLDFGRVPRKIDTNACRMSGTQTTYTGISKPSISVSASAAKAMTPRDAERAGLAQSFSVGRRTTVLTDDADKVTLTVRGKGTLSVTPVGDAGAGTAVKYALGKKAVTVAPPATPGARPVVRQGKKKLKPLRKKRRR